MAPRALAELLNVISERISSPNETLDMIIPMYSKYTSKKNLFNCINTNWVPLQMLMHEKNMCDPYIEALPGGTYFLVPLK